MLAASPVPGVLSSSNYKDTYLIIKHTLLYPYLGFGGIASLFLLCYLEVSWQQPSLKSQSQQVIRDKF